MAVTGVNNYSNIYTNAYTGNIRKNNAKETTEKQVVEQTEDVKTGTTRKTAADELPYLSKKFDNYSFVSANYSPGMKYGKSTTTNVAISPQFLTKMANDSDLEDEYIKEIGNMKKLDEQFAKQQADIGWRVEQGWAIDKDGNISSWAIGHKDSKVKSFLQNMSEKAEEILQKQLEKANLNYQNHLLVVAQDIDETVALMCYIQLSLLGVAGYVKVGNSLTEPITDNDNKENYWFTPMYFSNVWVLRRIFGGR